MNKTIRHDNEITASTYDTKDSIDEILDCFSGDDGGIGFVKLKTFLEIISANDSEKSREAKDIVRQFARLIRKVKSRI